MSRKARLPAPRIVESSDEDEGPLSKPSTLAPSRPNPVSNPSSPTHPSNNPTPSTSSSSFSSSSVPQPSSRGKRTTRPLPQNPPDSIPPKAPSASSLSLAEATHRAEQDALIERGLTLHERNLLNSSGELPLAASSFSSSSSPSPIVILDDTSSPSPSDRRSGDKEGPRGKRIPRPRARSDAPSTLHKGKRPRLTQHPSPSSSSGSGFASSTTLNTSGTSESTPPSTRPPIPVPYLPINPPTQDDLRRSRQYWLSHLGHPMSLLSRYWSPRQGTTFSSPNPSMSPPAPTHIRVRLHDFYGQTPVSEELDVSSMDSNTPPS
ncbi:MAG: hypothetical protein DHS80DRAFT_25034 [Piptocephalis tieghemiana]|nr:MAG: hypothetical protein DHS80DRAFT_25034 [Piptocephalis tieghemiana]